MSAHRAHAMPAETRREHKVLWNWSYNSCGCWESNPDPMQEQQALLNAAPSAAHITHCFREGYQR